MIKYRHFIGLIIRTISADGIAPIKGPKNGIILVMPTKTLISKAYGILQSDVTMKQSIPMIMESIIFQSVTDYLGRVILIRRWLLCANIYKVNQRFMGMSQENHLPIS